MAASIDPGRIPAEFVGHPLGTKFAWRRGRKSEASEERQEVSMGRKTYWADAAKPKMERAVEKCNPAAPDHRC
jgi:hypothetical protein